MSTILGACLNTMFQLALERCATIELCFRRVLVWHIVGITIASAIFHEALRLNQRRQSSCQHVQLAKDGKEFEAQQDECLDVKATC